jgi:hypothetical protein
MTRLMLEPRPLGATVAGPMVRARAPNRDRVVSPLSPLSRPPSLLLRPVAAAPKDSPTPSTAKGGGAGESSGLGFKAAWVAAELLGDVVAKRSGGGGGGSGGSEAAEGAAAPTPNNQPLLTREQILDAIRDDFERNYFLTGQGDMRAYADDCLYADPFSSFRGTARFKKNVANFGAVVDAVKVELGELSVAADPRENPPPPPSSSPSQDTVAATWRFSGIVKVLPWRPVLAAKGATRHVIDPDRMLVVEHIEEWASSPGEVLERLWEPSNKGPPVNRWEAAFGALAREKKKGDGRAGGGVVAAVKAAVEWRAPEAVTTGEEAAGGGGGDSDGR